MKESGRRKFLKFGSKALMGGVAGSIFYPVAQKARQEVEKQTGRSMSNANMRANIEAQCKDRDDLEQCAKEYVYSPTTLGNSIVVAPIIEELTYRGLPSLHYMGDESGGMNTLINGTGGLTLSRREVLLGIASSTVFGLMHNITQTKDGLGIDTKTIPVSQSVAGLGYWYLQRKLGIAANIAAHMIYNVRAFGFF